MKVSFERNYQPSNFYGTIMHMVFRTIMHQIVSGVIKLSVMNKSQLWERERERERERECVRERERERATFVSSSDIVKSHLSGLVI